MGAPFFNFRGKLEILDASVPQKLRTAEFEQQHLAQYWLDGRALKLHLYREWEVDNSFDYVDLVIETQAGDDEGVYDGSYTLTVFDSADAEGKRTANSAARSAAARSDGPSAESANRNIDHAAVACLGAEGEAAGRRCPTSSS